jgi:hypothetical protein
MLNRCKKICWYYSCLKTFLLEISVCHVWDPNGGKYAPPPKQMPWAIFRAFISFFYIQNPCKLYLDLWFLISTVSIFLNLRNWHISSAKIEKFVFLSLKYTYCGVHPYLFSISLAVKEKRSVCGIWRLSLVSWELMQQTSNGFLLPELPAVHVLTLSKD